ncbi:MAG TPA: 30S ribosomal protein S11 [Gammaproteobacteria bacterium]|nr:30S ribosomal protein S11 [Gammaproteobacteria bacterium]
MANPVKSTSKKPSKKQKKLPSSILVKIKAGKNNTIITFTGQDHQPIEGGGGGYGGGQKGARKGTSFAAEQTANTIARKLKERGAEDCIVYINGTGNGKEGAVKGISDAGIRVLTIVDVTGYPHNGCRQAKKKRV